MALGGQEGEDHAAADEQPVGLAQQVVDDAELVGDLRAAEHDDVRPLGVVGQPAQHLDLVEDQLAGGVREPLRDVVDARLLAVHDAEAVGDVERRPARRARRRTRRARRRPCWSRAASNRRFSSRATSPSARPATARGRRRRRCRRQARLACRAARRAGAATGRERVLRVRRCPWGGRGGRMTTTRAPASASRLDGGHASADAAVVGDASSPSSGTLKSERTSTRLPRRSPRSSMVFIEGFLWLRPGRSDHGAGSRVGAGAVRVRERTRTRTSSWAEQGQRAADEGGEVDEAVGVAPLVVVPADDLDLVADAPWSGRRRRCTSAGRRRCRWRRSGPRCSRGCP